jgi:thiol:disulfide interchange protein DsbD
LSAKEVVNIFKQKNIAAFKADWTSKDEVITKELNKLGRNGVPVYVYYPGSKGSDPILLPEVLTPSIVLSTINKS